MHPVDVPQGDVDLDLSGYRKDQAEHAMLQLGETVGIHPVAARAMEPEWRICHPPGDHFFSGLMLEARDDLKTEASEKSRGDSSKVDGFLLGACHG